MPIPFPPPPKRHRPQGLEILYEDRDLYVINKTAGLLSTATSRNPRARTAEGALTDFFRKGAAKSRKRAFLVHRLDRETSGVMLFAKSGEAQQRIKDRWPETEKFYLAAVYGHFRERCGVFSSYLAENEDLFVHSVKDPRRGRLSRTEYAVIGETSSMSLVKIRLLSGRKNQIRVQFAEQGLPVVGDRKYGRKSPYPNRLCLHAKSISFPHPHDGRRLFFDTSIPAVFGQIAPGLGETDWSNTPMADGSGALSGSRPPSSFC